MASQPYFPAARTLSASSVADAGARSPPKVAVSRTYLARVLLGVARYDDDQSEETTLNDAAIKSYADQPWHPTHSSCIIAQRFVSDSLPIRVSVRSNDDDARGPSGRFSSWTETEDFRLTYANAMRTRCERGCLLARPRFSSGNERRIGVPIGSLATTERSSASPENDASS